MNVAHTGVNFCLPVKTHREKGRQVTKVPFEMALLQQTTGHKLHQLQHVNIFILQLAENSDQNKGSESQWRQCLTSVGPTRPSVPACRCAARQQKSTVHV